MWAPTNYLTIRGLDAIGRRDVAAAAAENHLDPPAGATTLVVG